MVLAQNAMECRAALAQAGYADPFDGCGDLNNGVLRAAGDPEAYFREDPLRILQGIRLAVCFDLSVDAATETAMLSQAQLLVALPPERTFEELCKLLPVVTAADLIRFGPIAAYVIPELKPMIGFDQHSPHHAYDLFTHTAYVTAGVPADLTLRWAALLHDIGKIPTFTRDETGRGHFYGHAPRGAQMADEALLRLKAPTALREQVVLLIDRHMTKITPRKEEVRSWLSRLGWEIMDALLKLQEADMGSKGVGDPEEMAQFDRIRELLSQIKAEDLCNETASDKPNGGNEL